MSSLDIIMGVTYKLKGEVVQFIISQRQGDPFISCRQLAECVSQQFGLRLSKSSVHDVLKESGVVTPRGRKPKDKFKIPLEKKKQIQASLSQVALVVPSSAGPLTINAGSLPKTSLEVLPPPNAPPMDEVPPVAVILVPPSRELSLVVKGPEMAQEIEPPNDPEPLQNGAIYEGAGRIFIKAALWDLGIFSEENIKEEDWIYYLTYASHIKVFLENSRSYVIDLLLPLQIGIRESADGMISNISPLIVSKTSNDELFKASMESHPGSKINKIAIVDKNDHIICEFSDVVDIKRRFKFSNRFFVESNCRNLTERAESVFFSQIIDNNNVMENILNLRGFDSTSKDDYIVNILIDNQYANKVTLEQAIERLNGMFLRDGENRLVSVKSQLSSAASFF